MALTAAGRDQQRRVGRRHARSVALAMTRSLTAAELTDLESLCTQLARGAAVEEGKGR